MQEQGDDGDEAADDGDGVHQAEQVLPRPPMGGAPVASDGTKRISQMATHRANQIELRHAMPTKNV
jgi:hypothetical protein